MIVTRTFQFTHTKSHSDKRQVYSIRFKKSAIDRQILQYGRKLDESGRLL